MSTRPWLETWKDYSSGKANFGVSRPGYRTVATRIQTHDEAVLIAAAPVLARALLDIRGALLRGDLNRDGATEVATQALIDAGVIEPES